MCFICLSFNHVLYCRIVLTSLLLQILQYVSTKGLCGNAMLKGNNYFCSHRNSLNILLHFQILFIKWKIFGNLFVYSSRRTWRFFLKKCTACSNVQLEANGLWVSRVVNCSNKLSANRIWFIFMNIYYNCLNNLCEQVLAYSFF